MSVVINQAKMSVSGSSGVDTFTLLAALAGFDSFDVAGVADGQTVNYFAVDGNAYEDGSGVYDATAKTLTRASIARSSAEGNAAIEASASTIVFTTVINGLGTAAIQNVGTGPSNLAQLDGSGLLPAAVVPAVFTTGDVKLTLKTAADTGWILFNDGTIGDSASGATFADASALALFTLLFANINDAKCPLLTSSGGATTRSAQTNAATAWAANCRMSLPKALGRALAVAGSGSGLTARSLGGIVGEEEHTLSTAELPNLDYTATYHYSSGYTGGAQKFPAAADSDGSINFSLSSDMTTDNTVVTVSDSNGGEAHNNMQPTTFLNVMVKL